MWLIPEWVFNLSLWPKIALTISTSSLILLVTFLLLSEWALHDGANRLLDERLVIAGMAASQLDDLLQVTITELEQTRQLADFDPTASNLSAEAQALTNVHSRIGAYASGIVFLNATGQMILSDPPHLYPLDTNLFELSEVTQFSDQGSVLILGPFQ